MHQLLIELPGHHKTSVLTGLLDSLPYTAFYTETYTEEFAKAWAVFRGRQWQPTPAFLPGKSYGQRSLVGSMQPTMGLQKSRT